MNMPYAVRIVYENASCTGERILPIVEICCELYKTGVIRCDMWAKQKGGGG